MSCTENGVEGSWWQTEQSWEDTADQGLVEKDSWDTAKLSTGDDVHAGKLRLEQARVLSL